MYDIRCVLSEPQLIDIQVSIEINASNNYVQCLLSY
jgi:hypothetical protein